MLIFREFFKTQSDKKYMPKRTKQHNTFKIFSGELAEYACNYNLYVILHENSHFLFKIISKYILKRINRKCFQKFSSPELPHSNRVSKIFIFR